MKLLDYPSMKILLKFVFMTNAYKLERKQYHKLNTYCPSYHIIRTLPKKLSSLMNYFLKIKLIRCYGNSFFGCNRIMYFLKEIS